MQQFFEILGVQPGTSAEELKKVWKKKCLECHPDRGGDESEFIKVMHAYKMITDPEYRDKQRFIPQERDLTFAVSIPISFDEAFFGTTVMANYARTEVTPNFTPIKKEELEPINLIIEVPAGSCNGFQKRFEGCGIKMGELHGDALVNIVVNGHPEFKLDGLDVVSDMEIPLETMLKGGKVEVATMHGIKRGRVKPGSSPGSKVTIKGAGVNKQGDHVAVINPIFPDSDELKKDNWKGLGIDWDAEVNDEEAEDLEKKFEEVIKKS